MNNIQCFDGEDLTYEEIQINKLKEENIKLKDENNRLIQKIRYLQNDDNKIMSNNAGIYRIYNKFTNKSYVGQSANVYERVKGHYNWKGDCYYSRDDWHYDLVSNPQDFEWEILKEGVHNQSDLDRLEIYYIGKYDCIDNGYNKSIQGKNRITPTIYT